MDFITENEGFFFCLVSSHNPWESHMLLRMAEVESKRKYTKYSKNDTL